jgi:orotidine 5'-phosphate decarboxylase subfamily 1
MYQMFPDLDKMTWERGFELTALLGPHVEGVKAHSMVEDELSRYIRELKKAGAKSVMVDRKINDMKDTAEERARKLKDAGADYITVHSDGRIEMIAEAVKHGPPVFVVTKLTSWSDKDIEDTYHMPVADFFTQRALWALEAGAYGIVGPGKHVGVFANNPKLAGLRILIPGARNKTDNKDDQKQSDTPENIMKNGGEQVVLVAGRPVMQAADPLAALHAWNEQMQQGLAARTAATA